jgi:glycopeptide antibiotics resistance protein
VDLRRFGLLLAIATVLVAIALTQYPFHYQLTRHNVLGHWRDIDWRWFPRNGRHGHIRVDRDLVLNLLMLIPLGMGFALWRRAPGWRIVVEAIVLGAVIATGLELAQLVTLYRFTSFADMWRNTVSCGIGALWVLAIVPRSWRGFRATA